MARERRERVTIEELGADSAARIFPAVAELIRELDDGTVDLASIPQDAVASEWRERPDAMRAFAALDDDSALLGVATVTEGFALYASGRFGMLCELYVSPEARSRGVGAALIDAVREYGIRCGWHRIEVTSPVGERWDRTRAFYTRYGFTPAGPKLKLPLP